ncbi:MAG: aminotransferase class IV [Planctomycetaceae bacterium]|nr:aminotransferase class IV [Planctomycetaceae bacterium]
MTQLYYRNGELVPGDCPTVSVFDLGFVQGVTVSEQLRTFGGRLFRLDEHMQRLIRSLRIVGLRGINPDALAADAETLAAHNHSLVRPDDDIGLTMYVTPGSQAADDSSPNVGMYTTPLPFHRWVAHYETGEHLVLSSVRQVPSNCWPAELKCRSRMHYYLADREARRRRPDARALLTDQDGFVAEASTAAVIMYRRDEGIVAPPPEKVLPSVSVGILQSLARKAGLPFSHRDIRPEEMQSADEVLLSSTSPCVVPVVSIDGQTIGDGNPGPVWKQLIDAWSELTGVNIIDQARRFERR